jgi:two-component system response regulator CpxR
MAKVILVDDDRTYTTLIKTLLEMDGFTIQVCPDAQRARKAADIDVDAFIVDCNLAQGDDGINLLRDIRGNGTHASFDVPVIMTSGDDRRADDAKRAGASSFLLKPYLPSDLSSELAILLNREN